MCINILCTYVINNDLKRETVYSINYVPNILMYLPLTYNKVPIYILFNHHKKILFLLHLLRFKQIYT